LEGQNEIRFNDFYEPFIDLLLEFGPPRKSYHPVVKGPIHQMFFVVLLTNDTVVAPRVARRM
jgi:hypothetical protein